MIRLISFMLVIAIIAMPLGGVTAAVQQQASETDATFMAQLFAEDTLVYASVPLPDITLIDQLDALVQQQSQTFGVPLGPALGMPASVRDLLNEALLPIGLTVESFFEMLGDHAAFGIGGFVPFSAEIPNSYVLIEIRNRATAERLLTNLLGVNYERQQVGNVTLFKQPFGVDTYGVSDDHIMIFDGDEGVPRFDFASSLADSIGFNAAIDTLPEDHYSSALYFNMPAIFEIEGAAEELAPLGMTPEYTGPLVIGTVADAGDGISIIDSAQLPGPLGGAQPSPAVDPAFTQFLPGDVSLMVQATNLTALIEDATDLLLADASPEEREQSLAEFNQQFAEDGIDFQGDFLDWTTGDYAAFLSIDIVPIIRDLIDTNMQSADLNDRINFGMVIEATDPLTAQNFAAILGDLTGMELEGEQDVRVTNRPIRNVDSTVITATFPLSSAESFKIETAIGANDDIFFISTVPAIEQILGQDGILINNPDYIRATEFFLPDPSVVVYGDGAGVLFGAIVPTIAILAILGPTIGNPIDITDELNSQSRTMPSTGFASERAQPVDPFTAQAIEQLIDFIENSGTMSFTRTVTTEGATLLRFASVTDGGPNAIGGSIVIGAVGTIVVLALLGPAIGNIFDELVAELENP